jgi:RNA polymerase sigma-70 factor, ECF subfamily
MSEGEARRTAELAARTSYGRLVALLAARTGDIAAAEDALADAFVAALGAWENEGVPRNPDAWLLTAARNRLSNSHRHARVRDAAQMDVERMLGELAGAEPEAIPDARLRLLFACAHPAIDPAARAPLMLQTVLGLDAGRIGAAFLVAPATMGQRLVRAKMKIRDAGVRFEVPDPERLAERLPDVLDAVYAAYGTGWDEIAGDPDVSGLTSEALFLARLLGELLPDEPEVLGLLALMLYCEARRDARRDGSGAFVPLPEQDPRRWSRDMIVEAEGLLTAAARHARFGRYQCEAAIQSVHVQRPITGTTNWAALLTLHDLLARHAPSLGVLVGRAAVLLQAGQAGDALHALDALPGDRIAAYQPYWVTRARVLQALGQPGAADALARAIGLTRDPAVRDYLARAPAP